MARSSQDLRVIVPAREATQLEDLGFELGYRVGRLPFIAALASRGEVLSAAREGLADGMALNRLVPAPQPVNLPDGFDLFGVNDTEVSGASRLHARGITGEGSAIAVIDTGIQASHAYFRDEQGKSRIVAESCFVSSEFISPEIPCPGGQERVIGPGAADIGADTRMAHGTHVAGLAAGDARADARADGQTGIAPAANLVVSRVFGSPFAMDSDILAALDWVASVAQVHSIAAVNLSLGSFMSRYFDCQAVADSAYGAVTAKLRAEGVMIVAASGNNGALAGIGAPACASGWVSVGATDDLSRVAAFSNVGEGLDILAPGVNLWSAMPGDAYAGLSGTSMAAPVVAGAFALLRQAVPLVTPDEGLAAMRSTGPLLDDVMVSGLPTLRVDLAHNQLVGLSEDAPMRPAPPVNVTVEPRNGFTSVRWEPGSDGGSPITGYVIIGSPMSHLCFAKAPATSCSLGAIPAGSRYTVSVMARNAMGTSAPTIVTGESRPSSFPSDPGTVPGAVTQLKAERLKGAVRVRWGAPPSPKAVSKQTFEYRVNSGPWVRTTRQEATIKSGRGMILIVRVRAVNEHGPGPESKVRGSAR